MRSQNVDGNIVTTIPATITPPTIFRSLLLERRHHMLPIAIAAKNPPREYVDKARYRQPIDKRQKNRLLHLLSAVCIRKPVNGTSMSIPTAVPLLSPRNGMGLSFRQPGEVTK